MIKILGTNAIFRREALDTVYGITYGTLTEDSVTGYRIHSLGWKGYYMRKDHHKIEPSKRYRLAEGAIPDSVAASMVQRKRWFKGSLQILFRRLFKNESFEDLIDENWKASFDVDRVNSIKSRSCLKDHKPKGLRYFMIECFWWDSLFSPLTAITALCSMIITTLYLLTGQTPISFTDIASLKYFFLYSVTKVLINLLMSKNIDENDIFRAEQIWFSYAYAALVATMEALYWLFTGKDGQWGNTGALGNVSSLEIPNMIVILLLAPIGIALSLYRFFQHEYYERPWNIFVCLFAGFYIVLMMYPMVIISLEVHFAIDTSNVIIGRNVLWSIISLGVIYFVLYWEHRALQEEEKEY